MRILNGIYDSDGFIGVAEANDEAKLNKFSTIFFEKSIKGSRFDTAADVAGVCWDKSWSGSIDIPICDTFTGWLAITPNGFKDASAEIK